MISRVGQHAGLFENFIVRDQLVKLYSNKLVLEAEQQKLEERFEEIQNIESKKLRRVFGLMSVWYSV